MAVTSPSFRWPGAARTRCSTGSSSVGSRCCTGRWDANDLYDILHGNSLREGTDIRDLSADWLYKQIAYVGQATVKFELSAAENIAFGNLDHLDGQTELISEIAATAGIQSIIDKVPHGLGHYFGTKIRRLQPIGR
jgi:ABC-type multidrug transport system fused ATPase/permease subunit